MLEDTGAAYNVSGNPVGFGYLLCTNILYPFQYLLCLTLAQGSEIRENPPNKKEASLAVWTCLNHWHGWIWIWNTKGAVLFSRVVKASTSGCMHIHKLIINNSLQKRFGYGTWLNAWMFWGRTCRCLPYSRIYSKMYSSRWTVINPRTRV